MYQLNDHFSSFSTQFDFNKSNNLRIINQPSLERNMKSIEGINLTQENNTLNSHRMAEDYEMMLKTVNSFNSFNNSGHYIPQYPQRQNSSRIDLLQQNRVYNAQNFSSYEPVHISNTSLLNKKSKSYPMNNSQVSLNSIIISRESMNLTPQLQSPDDYSQNIKNKENMQPRNHMNSSRNNVVCNNMMSKRYESTF